MPEIHVSSEISRPPEAVFALIADITHYGRWLSPSSAYRETTDVSDTPIKAGTTYVDKNPRGMMTGQVTEYQPYTRIGFHQTQKNPNLDVTIRYQLTPVAGGTRLERSTTIVASGLARLIQPLVVGMTRRENQRTLAALKAYLEAQPHP